MCLGIPGRVVQMLPGNADQLALVDVLGVQRPINLGMLDDLPVEPGEWLMIHMGFAIERTDEAGATFALDGLQLVGRAMPDASAATPDRPATSDQEEADYA